LTTRGKHLICDNRKVCVSCSNYSWPPNLEHPQKYYHCKNCNTDIICKHGLNISFSYSEYDMVKTVKCCRCGETMEEKIWPDETEKENTPKSLKVV